MFDINSSLCRAQDAHGRWVQGYPLTVAAGRVILVESAGELVPVLMGPDLLPLVYHEVRPETICRFSGFYDKRGQRIFQKDVLLCETPTDAGAFNYMTLVEYADGAWFALHEGASLENAHFGEMGLHLEADDCLVIGNTLENVYWSAMWRCNDENS